MENHQGVPIKSIKEDRPKISIVIPCYNEAENMSVLFQKIKKISDNTIEVILVDNGSTDDTKSIISNKFDNKLPLIKTVYIEDNIGYGHGIMAGVKKASGNIISWTHADLQTDLNDVIDAYKLISENKDFEKCILKGKRIGRNPFDAFFTFGMSVLSSFMMGVKLSDINAQPKMFPRSFLKKLTNAPDDFSLDLFLLFKARFNSYEILEYPVSFGKRIYGDSKGGGTLKGKWKLIRRTWDYMLKLRQELK